MTTPPTDPLLERVDRMTNTMHDLAVAIKSESAKRSVTNRIIGVFLVIALVAAGIGIYAAYSTRNTADCVNDWANAYQWRASKVSSATADRSDALTEYNLSVARLAATIPQIQTNPKPFAAQLDKVLAAGKRLENADRDYQMTLRNNPLDKVAAKLHC